MTVNNVTFNGTTYGLRLKAGRGNGGSVTNVTYNDISMPNIGTPIQLSSWYNATSGSDAWPSTAANAGTAAVNSTTPFWSNITFSNITVNTAAQKSSIYALPKAPAQNIQFINDNLGDSDLQVNYAGFSGAYDPTLVPGVEVLLENTTIDRRLVTSAADLTNSDIFVQPTNGMIEADIAVVVPEPSCGFLIAGAALMLLRRGLRKRHENMNLRLRPARHAPRKSHRRNGPFICRVYPGRYRSPGILLCRIRLWIALMLANRGCPSCDWIFATYLLDCIGSESIGNSGVVGYIHSGKRGFKLPVGVGLSTRPFGRLRMGKIQQPMLFPMIPESGRPRSGKAPAQPQPTGSSAGRLFLALVALGLFAAMGYLAGMIIKMLNLPMPRWPFSIWQ